MFVTFAVGGSLASTSVDKRILIGDEVAVLQNNNIIGSARAIAPGWEWAKVPGKLARARHRL